jgi:hypothetical protein
MAPIRHGEAQVFNKFAYLRRASVVNLDPAAAKSRAEKISAETRRARR